MTERVDLDALVALERVASGVPWTQPVPDEPRLIGDQSGGVSLIGFFSYADAALIVAARNALPALITELRAERAAESERGKGHIFEGGTPEAMRDAKLRNEIFNCVEQHPTKPKIATWYYGQALQLISDYRAELTKGEVAQPAWVAVGERMPEDGQHVFFFTSWLDICQGRFDAGGKRMFNEKVGSWDIGAVTHWMPRRVDPLPSPPEST